MLSIGTLANTTAAVRSVGSAGGSSQTIVPTASGCSTSLARAIVDASRRIPLISRPYKRAADDEQREPPSTTSRAC